MGVKLLLLFTTLYPCVCTLVSDVFITDVEISVPQGASVPGNTASNVNIILCKIAVPPKCVIFSGTNICRLSGGAFPVVLQRTACNDHFGILSTTKYLLACSAQQLVITMPVQGSGHFFIHLFEVLIFLLFVFFVPVSSLKKIYREEANVYTGNHKAQVIEKWNLHREY